MRRYIPLADQPRLIRFMFAAGDVVAATVVITTTAAIMITDQPPDMVRIFFPIIDAGAALLLGYSMGMRETERLARKSQQPEIPHP